MLTLRKKFDKKALSLTNTKVKPVDLDACQRMKKERLDKNQVQKQKTEKRCGFQTNRIEIKRGLSSCTLIWFIAVS